MNRGSGLISEGGQVLNCSIECADSRPDPRWLVMLLIAGCAAQPPLAKPQVTQAEFDADRLHCQALMYQDRVSRGRMPPNWNLYEQCMRARGYAR
jgi:hypothetical protein